MVNTVQQPIYGGMYVCFTIYAKRRTLISENWTAFFRQLVCHWGQILCFKQYTIRNYKKKMKKKKRKRDVVVRRCSSLKHTWVIEASTRIKKWMGPVRKESVNPVSILYPLQCFVDTDTMHNPLCSGACQHVIWRHHYKTQRCIFKQLCG